MSSPSRMFSALAVGFVCPTCWIGPGEWCETDKGERAVELHWTRLSPFLTAYSAGLNTARTLHNTAPGTVLVPLIGKAT